MAKKKRKKRKSRRILTAVLIVLILGGAVAALHFLFVTEFYTQGTKYCDSRKILQDTFQEENDRRLLSVIRKIVLHEPKTPVFTSEIELDSLKSLRVVVTEKEAQAQVSFGDAYLILTEDGHVLGKQDEKVPGIMEIEGLEILSYEDFALPELTDSTALQDSLEVSKFLEKYEVPTDSFLYSEEGFSLFLGEITVSLGKAIRLDDKFTELENQLPYYEGLHGTIHLETLDQDGSSEGFYFTVE